MRSIDELNRAAKESKDAFGVRGEHNIECSINIVMGDEGLKLGAENIVKSVIEELEARQKFNVAVILTPFEGNKELMPMIQINDSHGRQITYGNLDQEKIHKIIIEHIMFGKIVKEYQVSKEVK